MNQDYQNDQKRARSGSAVKDGSARRAPEQTEERRRKQNTHAHPVKEMYLAAEHEMTRVKRRWRHILREKRAHHFPESERLPIQLLLLIWGMLPMLGSKVQEHTLGRQKKVYKSSNMQLWLARHKIHPALFLGGGCALAAALFVSIYTMGTTVSYDGEVIACVTSTEGVEQIRTEVEAETSKILGEPFAMEDSLFQYSEELVKRSDLTGTDHLESYFSDQIGLVTDAWSLYVDGVLIGSTPYEGALEQLLEQLKTASSTEGTISCEFGEEIEIQETRIPVDEVMNLGHIAEVLYSTKTEEVTYEVKKGDTWGEIAEDHGLTNKELLALNPGYDINRLQIGEVLTMSASVPYLTLTVMERERYVEDVQFDVIFTDDPTMWQGDEKVTSPGSYGAADVVANVTYVNGEETKRTVLSSVTLTEPVTEHRLRGTKERPTWHPTGTFRWPLNGRVTSYFGGRKSPGGIGSTNHKGLDIAAPKGTPVYAADGGTVTYAGWMSGYGYTIRIEHTGTGYTTFYAHNSSLTVKVGAHVYKGQQIARVGSTGNSTGNHCHFEIRYNGTPRNPMNYLR